MLQVYISAITVKKLITIDVGNADILSNAILLGASGELLKNFQLKEDMNLLSLDESNPLFYTLRIEAEQQTKMVNEFSYQKNINQIIYT